MSAREYLQFLQIAFGSVCELQYLIVLVGDLDLLPEPNRTTLTAQCSGVVKQLNRLIVAVYRSENP